MNYDMTYKNKTFCRELFNGLSLIGLAVMGD